MEWLSHSQKKHCELCKTPFRFTKLYHPHMPDRLPMAIFFQRAALHVLKSILTWFRGVFVACTWLVWLPWSMRFVWWGLLWIADGGWMGDELFATTPSAPMRPSNHTALPPQLVLGFLAKLHGLSDAIPGSSPLAALFNGYAAAQNRSAAYLELHKANATAAEASDAWRRDTLLSEVPFLTNLTSSPLVNSFAIDVLEGQIIMFAILTAVILVFLIREWVVQQQPAMNLPLHEDPLANNAADAAQPFEVIEAAEDPAHAEPQQAEVDGPARPTTEENIAARHAATERVQPRAPDNHIGNDRIAAPERPGMPGRHTSSVATDVMRSLEECSVPADGGDGRKDEGEDEHEPSAAHRPTPAADSRRSSVDTPIYSDGFSVIDADASHDAAHDEAESSNSADQHVQHTDETASIATDNGSTASNNETADLIELAELAAANAAENARSPSEPTKSWADAAFDFLWGEDIPRNDNEPQGDDEHVVENVHDEAPFVPVGEDFHHEQEVPQPLLEPQLQQDPEVAQAMIQAGLNPNDGEAAEDLEDLEGLLELIGMQGNLFGLLQNAIFMAVVGAAAITTGVWFPYLWGKVTLLFVAHPLQVLVQLPLQLVSGMANLAVDMCIYFAGAIVFWFDSIIRTLTLLIGLLVPSWEVKLPVTVGRFAADASNQSAMRIAKLLLGKTDSNVSDYMHLSASAHASLRQLQANFDVVSSFNARVISTLYNYAHSGEWEGATLREIGLDSVQYVQILSSSAINDLFELPRMLSRLSWVDIFNIQIQNPAGSLQPLDLSLAIWNGTDRLLAVVAGYVFFALLGTIYIAHIAPLATTSQAKKVEDAIIDVLQQAGGIMKVIVIISIEMLLFPLYCGALLDVATLPLFANTTFHDRVIYTLASPWISAFIHWFAGTCYMFHFALFVSMCRKIFRSGVLYFIRDPDDPTFHPVRDVLERNLTSQLRKIMFSALIYGGLVIFCMGSVVWTMAYLDTGVLPVRWTSTFRISGFPIDLLLYTSLRPIVVKLWSPSNGLHALYCWWFNKTAAVLKIRDFVLGEGAESDKMDTDNSGRLVRAPGSDQARIPRGYQVFVDVNANNERIDGKEDQDEGIHGRLNPNFKVVYVPKHFAFRVTTFVACLWALTAAIGLTMTVLPLIFGRSAFKMLLPAGTHTSDAYAFAVGLVPLALAIYSDSWIKAVAAFFKRTVPERESLKIFALRARDLASRVVKIAYTYTALLLIVPCSIALVIELYLVGPFHAYFAGGRELRVIHMLQGWTLGVQYTRILVAIVQRYSESRPARAMRAVVQDGWLQPNVRLATQGFILPLSVLAALAVLAPLPLGYVASLVLYAPSEAAQRAQVVRFAYPAVLSLLGAVWVLFAVFRALARWRLRIRDEVYLIGERLHNFGESKPPNFAKHTATRIAQS